ncbi:MAG: hypothetical protein KBE91_05705 [Bacteroidia bacterium]|nr:hypothetical protein [Bacteroidia bacterium]
MKQFDPEKVLEEKAAVETFYEKKAVLGIDIYGYSQYDIGPQSFIPVLFDLLYRKTVADCLEREGSFFSNYANLESLKKNFIPTGDGGFQIIETPFHAILFISIFKTNLKLYHNKVPIPKSEYKILPKLRDQIGEIELRFCITFDNIMHFDDNYFGPAIINCARILSKDSLNRFLIDQATVSWFEQELGGIENLSMLKLITLAEVNYFKTFKLTDKSKSYFFQEGEIGFRTINLLKIGKIKSKNTELMVYNLHVQLRVNTPLNDKNIKHYIITIGNLNTTGIQQ